MRRHLKRQVTPKEWGLPKKGKAFVVKNNSKGIPLVIAIRDKLDLAQNKREVKKAIHNKQLLISGKLAKDQKNPLELFDILTIVPSKENYRLTLDNTGKYAFEKISEKEANNKVSKIIGKKMLSSKKIQLNLLDGRNYLSSLDCKVGDSMVIDLKENKPTKVLSLAEKANILIIGGKHKGMKAKITKMLPEMKMAEIKTEDSKFNVLTKHLIVTQ